VPIGLPLVLRAVLAKSEEAVDFGAHLPLMDFGGHPYTLDHLVAYTKTAAQLGFDALSVNDHLVFSVPWLDGPTALAAAMEHSQNMTLATTVVLATVRGRSALPPRRD
jgi:alkanesulfonate monooxygenase SsuD/methylene tetrahydromethanopterin reductase-like flavin-dependent oxidoreductase (luciferase family)